MWVDKYVPTHVDVSTLTYYLLELKVLRCVAYNSGF